MSRRTGRRRRAVLGGVAVVATLALASPAPATAQTAPEPGERVLEIIRRVVPFDGRATEVAGEQITVTLDGDVLFEFDQAALTPAAQATLIDLAAELAEDATGTATVVGHTDSIGTDEYNLDLSGRRAESVQAFLAPLVDGAVTFTVEGRGESQPVAENTGPDGADDPEGRRRNRRVELTYTPVA